MSTVDLLPEIVLAADDYQRLLGLVSVTAETAPDVSNYLAGELDRAIVVSPEEVEPTVVTMNTLVTFRDETTGQVRTVTLVYPYEADLATGKVSVLTPIGAALIGVAEGQSICWRTRTGETKRLTVTEVKR